MRAEDEIYREIDEDKLTLLREKWGMWMNYMMKLSDEDG